MKANREKDYWIYQNQNGRIAMVYCIDGVRMGKYSAAQYLMDKHQMSQKEAFDYLETQIQHF